MMQGSAYLLSQWQQLLHPSVASANTLIASEALPISFYQCQPSEEVIDHKAQTRMSPKPISFYQGPIRRSGFQPSPNSTETPRTTSKGVKINFNVIVPGSNSA